MVLPRFHFNRRHTETAVRACSNNRTRVRTISVQNHAGAEMKVNVRVVLGSWREFLVY